MGNTYTSNKTSCSFMVFVSKPKCMCDFYGCYGRFHICFVYMELILSKYGSWCIVEESYLGS